MKSVFIISKKASRRRSKKKDFLDNSKLLGSDSDIPDIDDDDVDDHSIENKSMSSEHEEHKLND